MASQASDATIPDPPVWGFNPAGNQGDFARLVPRSPLARRAFANIVQRMQEEPHWNEHARRFIHFAEYTGSDSDSDATTAIDGGTPPREVRWYGYYRLNWDIPPARPLLGWVLGSSRPDQPDAVDLLLTPHPKQFRVAGRHCRLTHNCKSGALLVAADNHRVTIDGTTTLRHNSRVAYRNTGILIHDLTYSLEFTNLDPSIAREQLEKTLAVHRTDTRHPSTPALTPTPYGAISVCDDFVVHAPAAGGTYGAVSYGTHIKTGAPVAIKRVRGCKDVDNEISLLRSLNHENVCRIEKVMHASGNLLPNPMEERLIVLTPLATCTLDKYISIPLRSSELLAVMSQFVSGLEYIHHNGVMHRDIKLQNVGVAVHPDRLQIVLLDFGHATKSSESTDHMRGTIPYLAPEVIALKEGRSLIPYNNSVDVWSMGLCMFALASQARVTWKHVTKKRHEAMIAKLDRLKSELKLSHLGRRCLHHIREMLQWDPVHRPSAASLAATMPTVSRKSRDVEGTPPPSKRARG